ncbi:MAG: ABC transporter ATP-binding protein [bacterium]|nr:ABC transporter ATP-binding protein [bacterium]
MRDGGTGGALAVAGVTLRRRGRSLLNELRLRVDPGEVVAVMGPSGAGKTTLLRTVAGLAAPDSGTIERPGDRVAVVFQDPRLLPWRTALENVELVCEAGGKYRARDWLGRVGLDGDVDLFPAALSGGMRQRVAVARALAYDAPVVLVDEPFASLDGPTATALRDELATHLRAEKRTVLWVTHHQDVADAVAARTLVMDGPPSGSWRIETAPARTAPAQTAPERTTPERATPEQTTP